jgi:hypothetical protein
MSTAALFTEKYKKLKDGSWRFNVYFETTGDDWKFAVIQHGWGLKDGKLMAPYSVIKGKCFTMTRVSPDLAKAIFIQAVNKISELDGTVLEVPEDGWKRPMIGQSSFKLAFPEYYASTYPPRP